MSIFTGLTLLFVAAKLFGFIDWSWWLVLAPSFVGIIFVVVAVVLATAAKIYADK